VRNNSHRKIRVADKRAITMSRREAESPKMSVFVESVGIVRSVNSAKPPSREAMRKKTCQEVSFFLRDIK
jgi:hypothetical protein